METKSTGDQRPRQPDSMFLAALNRQAGEIVFVSLAFPRGLTWTQLCNLQAARRETIQWIPTYRPRGAAGS